MRPDSDHPSTMPRREFLRTAARVTTVTGLAVLAGRLTAEWASSSDASCTNAGRCGGCGRQGGCGLPDAISWRHAGRRDDT